MPRDESVNNPVMRSSDGVSIRDYVDLRFAELQRSIDKAELSMGARLAGMNEFRDTLRDQASRFITRADLKALEAEVRALCKLADRAEGKASHNSVLWTGAIAIAGLVISLVRIFMK